MPLECSVCAAFHRWLEEKEGTAERLGLLVELSFLDGYVKEKGFDGIFSLDFTRNPRRMERMLGTLEFRKYLDQWVSGQNLEDHIAEELRWKKWEQLMQASAFYVRFLKSYRKHSMMAWQKKGRRPVSVDREPEAVDREIIRFLASWLHIPLSSMKKLALSLPSDREKGGGLDELWEFLPFRRLVQLKIFDIMDMKGKMTFADMEKEWKNALLPRNRLEEVISFLREKGLVECGKQGYVRTCFDQTDSCPTARCFLESMSNERYRMILSMRLDGCSLKTIGERLYITRERVR